MSWSVYVKRILAQVHPDLKITGPANSVFGGMINRWLSVILGQAILIAKKTTQSGSLVSQKKDKTELIQVSTFSIECAIETTLPGELQKHAIESARKSLKHYLKIEDKTTPQQDNPLIPQTAATDLILPIGRVHKMINERINNIGLKLRIKGAIYLCSVLEYLCAEVLELTGNAACDNQKVTIIPRFIAISVMNDEEISKFTPIHCTAGGVMPNIMSVLLPTGKHAPKSQEF